MRILLYITSEKKNPFYHYVLKKLY